MNRFVLLRCIIFSAFVLGLASISLPLAVSAQEEPDEYESSSTPVDGGSNAIEPDGEPSHLDATYVSNGEKVIDEQLTRAGVRLADMLNAIFQE